ncbi:MAG: DUF2800 domain-containing protein [Candidatus Methanofishera endochildressiae]|uniref:DUF2800 domain-containing protein n=1 Tax=Candidatus Methanofishera endochildressiae TaxID=2738884 RepID=A0A7Z0MN95_9GAMM|nr:DUF2800 domain-containing protein [Candidatus Methanofishera endochildressiae]
MLVAGKSRRYWTDSALDELIEKIGDEATTSKIITITQADKLLDKKEVEKLTFKKEGKPSLVQTSDPRQALELDVNFD